MSTEQTYSQLRLPDLIKSLKSQVSKNLEIVKKEVERDLTSDKYFNVLKGRRMAAELAIKSMHQIDKIEQNLKVAKEDSFFKENLPNLIEHLKEMFDINLVVVNIDVDDEDDIDKATKEITESKLQEVFNADKVKKLIKKLGLSDGLSEDKYANVIKARGQAEEDCIWVLEKIDELEAILYEKEVTNNKKKSWAMISAEKNKS